LRTPALRPPAPRTFPGPFLSQLVLIAVVPCESNPGGSKRLLCKPKRQLLTRTAKPAGKIAA
jgi:hypothetical protein